ncbi:hypothetical protein RKD26_003454 [Streptomyces calvus]
MGSCPTARLGSIVAHNPFRARHLGRGHERRTGWERRGAGPGHDDGLLGERDEDLVVGCCGPHLLCPVPFTTSGPPANTVSSPLSRKPASPAGTTRDTEVPGAFGSLTGGAGKTFSAVQKAVNRSHVEIRALVEQGRRHPQAPVAPRQDPLLDHPHHEPRPSRPDPCICHEAGSRFRPTFFRNLGSVSLGQRRVQLRMPARWSAAWYAMASLSVRAARPRHCLRRSMHRSTVFRGRPPRRPRRSPRLDAVASGGGRKGWPTP